MFTVESNEETLVDINKKKTLTVFILWVWILLIMLPKIILIACPFCSLKRFFLNDQYITAHLKFTINFGTLTKLVSEMYYFQRLVSNSFWWLTMKCTNIERILCSRMFPPWLTEIILRLPHRNVFSTFCWKAEVRNCKCSCYNAQSIYTVLVYTNILGE